MHACNATRSTPSGSAHTIKRDKKWRHTINTVSCPLDPLVWAEEMQDDPDKDYIVGLTEGFSLANPSDIIIPQYDAHNYGSAEQDSV